MGIRASPNTCRKAPEGHFAILHLIGSYPANSKQHQRALEKAQRELDRERMKLEQQEKKLIADIKRSAKNNQMGACKIQAKDLVRTRKYVSITMATSSRN